MDEQDQHHSVNDLSIVNHYRPLNLFTYLSHSITVHTPQLTCAAKLLSPAIRALVPADVLTHFSEFLRSIQQIQL